MLKICGAERWGEHWAQKSSSNTSTKGLRFCCHYRYPCTLHDSVAEKCRHSTNSLSNEVQGLGQEDVFCTLDVLMQNRTVSCECSIAKGWLLKLDELYKCVWNPHRKSQVASSLWRALYINFPWPTETATLRENAEEVETEGRILRRWRPTEGELNSQNWIFTVCVMNSHRLIKMNPNQNLVSTVPSVLEEECCRSVLFLSLLCPILQWIRFIATAISN